MSSDSAPPKESAIDKAIFTIQKLEGHENWSQWATNIGLMLAHTWSFMEGDLTTLPEEGKPKYESWRAGDHNTH